MNNPQEFYTSQIDIHSRSLKTLKKQLAISSTIRLLVFLAIIATVYFGYPNTQIIIGSILIGIILFLILVTKHGKLSYNKKKLQKLIDINQLELEVAKGVIDKLDSGTEFIDPAHEFSHDIDLFGHRSFFQFTNRTATLAGKNLLASIFKSNNIKDIKRKQEAIQNLCKLPAWRQEFCAVASLASTQITVTEIVSWFHAYTSFVPRIMKWFPSVFSFLSLIVFILFYLDFIGLNQLILWLFVGLTITAVSFKKLNKLYNESNKIKNTVDQYYQLITLIENTTYISSSLKSRKKQIVNETEKASTSLKKLSKILNAFDQRNNLLLGPLINGFFLWDLRYGYHLEQWIYNYKNDVEQWFEVIAFFDACNSLGNFAFNHPAYVYPSLTSENTIINAKDLGHPMLLPEKRVDNDISILKDQFFIITGANMAGKSTFLRTVALQIVMSNIGLPVCATSCSYRPIKLITSMRTSDSLSDDASYFFSELTQLKRIVDMLSEDEYFIILDEILKGTNSKDKAAGSRKFIEKLVAANATGIIATHDLSLCEIATELKQVQNKFFDAQIINDELFFDYTFKEGICQNMNASFLLRKMGIV